MIWWMFLRVWVISVSTGVPRIGKKRIRCSGGGNTVMSLIRSSSVWLVFSTLRYQASLAGGVWAVMLASSWSGWWGVGNGGGEKNRRGSGASGVHPRGVAGGGWKAGGMKKTAGLLERRRLLRGACYRLCTRSSSAGKRDKEPEIKRAEHLHGRQCSTAARRHAVPPTVRPSMRSVGCPTPTGTLWPALPQVPTPLSRRMSLPISVTFLSASGPLPMMVAPLTGYWILPFSTQ